MHKVKECLGSSYATLEWYQCCLPLGPDTIALLGQSVGKRYTLWHGNMTEGPMRGALNGTCGGMLHTVHLLVDAGQGVCNRRCGTWELLSHSPRSQEGTALGSRLWEGREPGCPRPGATDCRDSIHLPEPARYPQPLAVSSIGTGTPRGSRPVPEGCWSTQNGEEAGTAHQPTGPDHIIGKHSLRKDRQPPGLRCMVQWSIFHSFLCYAHEHFWQLQHEMKLRGISFPCSTSPGPPRFHISNLSRYTFPLFPLSVNVKQEGSFKFQTGQHCIVFV